MREVDAIDIKFMDDTPYILRPSVCYQVMHIQENCHITFSNGSVWVTSN